MIKNHYTFRKFTGIKTSGPENPLFKSLKKRMESVAFEADPSKLKVFNWQPKKDTVIEEAGNSSVEFCKAYLGRTDKHNLRHDRQELAELTLLYLTGDTTIRIRKPGAITHARFIGKATYIIKLYLLSSQLSFLTGDQIHELEDLCEFITCFYTKLYLLSDDAISAPYLDISTIQQMIR